MKKTQIASTVETSTAPVAVVNWSFIATQVAENALGYKGATEQADSFMVKANDLAQQMIKAKVKIGSRAGKNPCSIAVAFVDRLTKDYIVNGALICKGIAEGTATKVYLPAFKDAVNNGKKLDKWNIYRTGKETTGNGNGTNAKGKGTTEFSNVLVKAFNHAEGKSFENICNEIDKHINDTANDYQTVYQGFIYFLEKEGFEISEKKAA
jgi:hypothetical protein